MCSSEGLPGVEGSERSDGGGGNWGDPPRPGDLRMTVGVSRLITGDEPGSRRGAGRESEAAVLLLEPAGQHNPGRGKGRCFVHASRIGKDR